MRSLATNIFNLFRKPKPAIHIVTPYGMTTEWARHQAGINMRNDADLREKVIASLAKELGSITKAEMELRRRYPEIFEGVVDSQSKETS